METRSAVSNPYTLTVNQNFSVSASIKQNQYNSDLYPGIYVARILYDADEGRYYTRFKSAIAGGITYNCSTFFMQKRPTDLVSSLYPDYEVVQDDYKHNFSTLSIELYSDRIEIISSNTDELYQRAFKQDAGEYFKSQYPYTSIIAGLGYSDEDYRGLVGFDSFSDNLIFKYYQSVYKNKSLVRADPNRYELDPNDSSCIKYYGTLMFDTGDNFYNAFKALYDEYNSMTHSVTHPLYPNAKLYSTPIISISFLSSDYWPPNNVNYHD